MHYFIVEWRRLYAAACCLKVNEDRPVSSAFAKINRK